MASAAAQLSLPRIFRSSPDVHCQSSSRHRSAVLPRFTGLKISSPAERIGGENAFRGTSAVPGRKGGKGEPLRLPSALARADVVVAAAEGGTRAPPRDRKQKLAPPSGRAGGAGRSGGGKIPYELEAVISNLVSLAPRGSISRCMETFKGKLTLPDFALIFKEFAQRGDWIRAMRLFKYMQRQQWCAPNEYIYTIMIGIMGREGMLDRAQELFEEMPENSMEWNLPCASCLSISPLLPHPLPPPTFFSSSPLSGREGMLDRAQELFEEMPEHGVEWNVYSFTALINAYGRNGMYEQSLDLLARMKREGVAANSITHNTVLRACAKSLLVPFEAPQNSSPTPPFPTPTPAPHPGPCQYEQSLDLLARMKREGYERSLDLLARMKREGVAANSITYNTVLHACAKGAMPWDALVDIFAKMRQDGVQPNIVTFNTLLAACNALSPVSPLFTPPSFPLSFPPPAFPSPASPTWSHSTRCQQPAMPHAHSPSFLTPPTLPLSPSLHSPHQPDIPDIVTFNALLVACFLPLNLSSPPPFSSPFPPATPSHQPDIVTFNTLLAACNARSLVEQSAMVFRSMVASQVPPNALSYASLVDTHRRGGQLGGVRRLFQEMSEEEGVVADVSAYNMLIDAYAWGGEYQAAQEVFNEMQQAGCIPNVATYTALLKALGSNGSYHHVFNEMQQAGCIPNVATYTALLKALGSNGSYHHVRSVFTQMKASGRKPDLATYQTLLDVFISGGFFREASRLFWDMEEDGVEVDEGAFTSLLVACGLGGLTTEATEIYRFMRERSQVQPSSSLMEALFMREQSQVQPSSSLMEALISAYGQAGMYDHALTALHESMEMGLSDQPGPFLALMEAYAAGGMHDDAAFVFALMMQSDGGREAAAGAGAGAAAGAAAFLSSPFPPHLPSSPLPPSGSLPRPHGGGPFLALMEAYAAGGMHDDAAFVFALMMQSDGGRAAAGAAAGAAGGTTGAAAGGFLSGDTASQKSSPSSPSLTGGSAGPYPADAPLRVFEASQKSSPPLTGGSGVYNEAIEVSEAFTEGGLYDEAIKVSEVSGTRTWSRPTAAPPWQRMQPWSQHTALQAAGGDWLPSCSPPPLCAFTLCQTFSPHTSSHPSQDMEQANCRPSLATHAAMVAAYSAAGTFEAAYAQTTEIREEGMVPPAASYCHLLALCARRGRWQDMRRLIAEMEGGGTGEEHRVVRGLLVGRYESEEFWPIAEDFFGRLKREGVEVNRVFLNALMDALWWAGRRATALKLDSTVLHASPLLSSPLLSSPLLSSPLLSSVWCVCPFISSHSFSTQREGVAVNRVFLNALMDALWEGVAVNRVFLNALMDALWWAGRRATALKLHAPVKDASVPLCVSLHSPPAQREGVAVNRVFLNALMDALWWAGRRATALKLHAPATSLAVFPEASYRSPTLWSLDVHRSAQKSKFGSQVGF
ncbi:unnamed protein product [Closterium sp. NIES-65]|nr:unnamed protein product [Closterium sp. NIES-65]